MDIKEVQQWYANKLNKEVSELDEYDLFCAKVAYDFASQHIRSTLYSFITFYNAKPKVQKGELLSIGDVHKFLE